MISRFLGRLITQMVPPLSTVPFEALQAAVLLSEYTLMDGGTIDPSVRPSASGPLGIYTNQQHSAEVDHPACAAFCISSSCDLIKIKIINS